MAKNKWTIIKTAWTGLRYLFDSKVPMDKKIWPLLAIVYLISPVDILPDPILGLGIMDDVAFIGLILCFMSRILKDYAEKQGIQSRKRDSDTIDVDYEVIDEDKP